MSEIATVAPLTKAQARRLTDKIRTAVETTWDLLLEAHDRQAWLALGYGSWEEFVGEEFGISRGHAYRLVDQAQVILELTEAAGVSPAGDIVVSDRAARDIKRVLPAVAQEVRTRVKGARKTARPGIVDAVVSQTRAALRPVPALTSPQAGEKTCPTCHGKGTVSARGRPTDTGPKPPCVRHPPGAIIGDTCMVCEHKVKR